MKSELGSSDAAIQNLNDWFLVNVKADPQQPGWLLSEWCSVVNGLSLFLGDVMVGGTRGVPRSSGD